MSGGFGEKKTWKDTMRKIKKTHRGFLNLVKRAIEQQRPDEVDQKRFDGLLGLAPMGGELRMSDLIAHFHLTKYVAQEVRHLNESTDEYDFYHLTLLADEGMMSDRTPMFPLRLLRRKADKAMRKAGLDGIYRVEIQPLMNWPQKGEGRTLLGHVHILGMKLRDSPGNSVEAIRRSLGYDKQRRNHAWSSKFGADPIHVRAITEDLGCPSYWSGYIMKPPHDAKNRIEKKSDEPDAWSGSDAKLMSTIAGYKPELAMRIFELFGQISLFATIGGVGVGAAILARCRNRVNIRDGKRRAKWARQGLKSVAPFNERSFWKRTHKRRRVKHRRFFIDGPTIAERVARRRR